MAAYCGSSANVQSMFLVLIKKNIQMIRYHFVQVAAESENYKKSQDFGSCFCEYFAEFLYFYNRLVRSTRINATHWIINASWN
jgi:hypothetical protein